MEESYFYHALFIDKQRCIGCSHCMRNCPTEALRIINGKASLYSNRCIDCGLCYEVCPVGAINVAQDDFNSIFHYPYRVAVFPSVFLGQFNDYINEAVEEYEIYEGMMELGFTHVFEVEKMVDFLSEYQMQYAMAHSNTKPLISTFCPAVVRLIQVKYPALTENLVLLKQPIDVAAMYMREKLKTCGASENEIGIFYISPCAAKMAAVKNPVGEEHSSVDGVINMDFFFNRLLRKIKEKKSKKRSETYSPTEKIEEQASADSGILHSADSCFTDAEKEERAKIRSVLSSKDILWALTEGESKYALGRSLAIDGIEQVNAYLERLEDQEDPDVDFLELRACDNGCAGGIMVSGLRFLVSEQLKKRAFDEACKCNGDKSETDELTLDQAILNNLESLLPTERVLPRSMLKLDTDIKVAMRKMDSIREYMRLLPQKDCGVCGAPSCLALSEDIANDVRELKDCVFLQTFLEEKGNMNGAERVEIFKKIWGEDIFKQYHRSIDEDKKNKK